MYGHGMMCMVRKYGHHDAWVVWQYREVDILIRCMLNKSKKNGKVTTRRDKKNESTLSGCNSLILPGYSEIIDYF